MLVANLKPLIRHSHIGSRLYPFKLVSEVSALYINKRDSCSTGLLMGYTFVAQTVQKKVIVFLARLS